MNTEAREHIGRLIRRFAARATTDELLILIAEHSGLLEACTQLLREAQDPVTAAWLHTECEAAKTRPALFLAEIEAILTIIKPSQEHADLYALLELEPGAGREAIKRNYRRLSRRYHPDTGGSDRDEDAFIRITKAYHTLMDCAETTPSELPATRRETSHWRSGAAADGWDARRTQKQRNVIVVAMLALALVFVSLLAARTYNSRIMMSGLKNKGVAFVPPTATLGKPAPATADTPQPVALAATPPAAKHAATTGLTPPTTPAAEHAAKVGCAPRTAGTPTEPSTPPAAKHVATTGPTPSITPATEYAAKVGCAPRTTGTTSQTPAIPHEHPAAPANPSTREPRPTELTTAATAATAPATAQTIPAPAAAEAPPQAQTATEPTAEAPAIHLTPTSRKHPVANHDKHLAAVQADTSPAAATPQLTATTPTDCDPSQVGCAPRTTSVPTNAPAATTPATPNTQLAATPTDCDSSQVGCASRTTNLPAHAAQTATVPPKPPTPAKATTQLPTEHQTRQRLETFLRNYTTAYEQKNLHTFAQFFALDAKENGKPLAEVLPAYTALFAAAETLRFTISPDRWQREHNGLNLSGRFTITMDLHDGTRREGEGTIDFRLTDTTPPQVQTLRYTFDQ